MNRNELSGKTKKKSNEMNQGLAEKLIYLFARQYRPIKQCKKSTNLTANLEA